MATSPAVAGKILRNFSIVGVSLVGGVFAAYEVFGFASRRQMGEFRGQLPLGDYNAAVRPEQDRLYVPDLIICCDRDTIYDRTKLLNTAKEKKPWNRTAAEKERAKW